MADEPHNLWEQLGQANVRYLHALSHLIELGRSTETAEVEVYDAALQHMASNPAANWDAEEINHNENVGDVRRKFKDAAACANACRTLLRDVGHHAKVAIEPAELTPLIDATGRLDGVLAAGCPGAGGYDAIFALVASSSAARKVEEFWEQYAALAVCPLPVSEDSRGLSFS